MVARKVARAPKFDSDLSQLGKKHQGIGKIVDAFLEERAKGAPLTRKDRMPGVGGRPVYKVRLPLPGGGKRHGARIIYYCGPSDVYALRIYDKSTIKEPPANDIKKALSDAGF